MATWTAHMTLTFRVTATVEADSKEEARAKFESADFDDDGMRSGELCDWGDVSSLMEDS